MVSMPLSLSAWATSKYIIRGRGIPDFFQLLTLGMERPNMRDTAAVPPSASMI